MMNVRLRVILIVASVLLGTGGTARADKCIGAKLKAIGKDEGALLACESKAAATGDSSHLGLCESKPMNAFAIAFGKAAGCSGNFTTCANIASICESSVVGAFVDTLPSGCEAAKRKAAGKLAKSELGCYAKAAAKGAPVDAAPGGCIEKARTKFTLAVSKAGTCPAGDSPQAFVETRCVSSAMATDGNGMVSDICPLPGACAFVTAWGSTGTGNGQFETPIDVAVDASGNVLVADTLNHRIQKFTNTGTFLGAWGSMGSGNGQFNAPSGVAVDASGNVFVTDTLNDRVQKFDDAGNFLLAWGTEGNGDGQFESPDGIATDASGNVFVSEDGMCRVQKFDSAGDFLTAWGSCGSADGQFDPPAVLATDGSGNVFVGDRNDRIQKFDSSGNFLTAWGSVGSGYGQLSDPRGMAIDGSGNVLVSEGDRIQKFDNSGQFLTAWGVPGTLGGQFIGPYGVAVDAAGNVFVADGNDRIQKFGCP